MTGLDLAIAVAALLIGFAAGRLVGMAQEVRRLRGYAKDLGR